MLLMFITNLGMGASPVPAPEPFANTIVAFKCVNGICYEIWRREV